MEEEKPKLYFFDKVFALTFLRLIPRSVKPNHLTVFRFLTVPFVVILLWGEHYWWGMAFFLVSALSDALDGAMARVRDQITTWGKIYDPLADKLLICSAVVILVMRWVDFYAALIIVGLEILMIAIAIFKKWRGIVEIQANVWGKIKMVLQVVGVVVLLVSLVFNLETLLPASRGVFYLAIAFAIVSLFTYSL